MPSDLVPRRSGFRGCPFHPLHQWGIESHIPGSRKFGETLSEIGIVGGQRGLDFALGHCGIKLVFQRTVGNSAGIIEALKRIGCARHDIGRSRSEQSHRNQDRPYPWYGRDALRQ